MPLSAVLPNMSPATVLVVDDDPIALEVTRERLEGAGFRVATRAKALGTSQWIMEHRPRFALLDIMMPALDGPALAAFLRQRQLTTNVILYSSKPLAEVEALAKAAGALGGISKSCNEHEFVESFLRLAAFARETEGSP